MEAAHLMVVSPERKREGAPLLISVVAYEVLSRVHDAVDFVVMKRLCRHAGLLVVRAVDSNRDVVDRETEVMEL